MVSPPQKHTPWYLDRTAAIWALIWAVLIFILEKLHLFQWLWDTLPALPGYTVTLEIPVFYWIIGTSVVVYTMLTVIRYRARRHVNTEPRVPKLASEVQSLEVFGGSDKYVPHRKNKADPQPAAANSSQVGPTTIGRQHPYGDIERIAVPEQNPDRGRALPIQMVHQINGTVDAHWDVESHATIKEYAFHGLRGAVCEFRAQLSSLSKGFNFATVIESKQSTPHSKAGGPFRLTGDLAFCLSKAPEENSLEASIRYHRSIIRKPITIPNPFQLQFSVQLFYAGASMYYIEFAVNDAVVLTHKVGLEQCDGIRMVAWSEGSPYHLLIDQILGRTDARQRPIVG